jgi:hypothetical protein
VCGNGNAGVCGNGNSVQASLPLHGTLNIAGSRSMSGFKQPDFRERQEAAAKAKKTALEKFRAKAADPALAERQNARTASAAERNAIKHLRDTEKAEKKARDAERARQAERDAAVQAERAKAETEERERALQVEQKAARDARYAARKSRSKRK